MTNDPPRFVDRRPEEYSRPEINPYLTLHRTYGPPVIIGEEAPGFRDRWSTAFGGREAPLHVEIGSGNGFFLAGMSARHPEWNWLGIEIRFKRVVLCAKKIDAAGVENARIARYDAWCLDDLFEPGAIAGLYVNFPDPWQKDKHEKKRLLGRPFAAWAARALQPSARVWLKSDHRPNIDRFVAATQGLPFEVTGRSEDVARDGAPWPDDLVTNYHRKFLVRNLPVHALALRRTDGAGGGASSAHGEDGG